MIGKPFLSHHHYSERIIPGMQGYNQLSQLLTGNNAWNPYMQAGYNPYQFNPYGLNGWYGIFNNANNTNNTNHTVSPSS